MGKFCEVCAKGSMSGHNVSHSNRKTNRIWAPERAARPRRGRWSGQASECVHPLPAQRQRAACAALQVQRGSLMGSPIGH